MLSSVEPNKFLYFSDGLFYDFNGSHPLKYEAVRPNVTAGDELDLKMNVTRLRSELMEYIEIQAHHASLPPACKWYQLSLRHPGRIHTNPASCAFFKHVHLLWT